MIRIESQKVSEMSKKQKLKRYAPKVDIFISPDEKEMNKTEINKIVKILRKELVKAFRKQGLWVDEHILFGIPRGRKTNDYS